MFPTVGREHAQRLLDHPDRIGGATFSNKTAEGCEGLGSVAERGRTDAALRGNIVAMQKRIYAKENTDRVIESQHARGPKYPQGIIDLGKMLKLIHGKMLKFELTIKILDTSYCSL